MFVPLRSNDQLTGQTLDGLSMLFCARQLFYVYTHSRANQFKRPLVLMSHLYIKQIFLYQMPLTQGTGGGGFQPDVAQQPNNNNQCVCQPGGRLRYLLVNLYAILTLPSTVGKISIISPVLLFFLTFTESTNPVTFCRSAHVGLQYSSSCLNRSSSLRLRSLCTCKFANNRQ